VLNERDVQNIDRLMRLRNPLIHWRDVNHPQNISRRAMAAGKHTNQIMYEDARFAIATVVAVVGKAHFTIGGHS
jgi:hypothetical protein